MLRSLSPHNTALGVSGTRCRRLTVACSHLSQDMTPTIRRAQKVLIPSEEEEQTPGGFSSRLAYTETALDPQVSSTYIHYYILPV